MPFDVASATSHVEAEPADKQSTALAEYHLQAQVRLSSVEVEVREFDLSQAGQAGAQAAEASNKASGRRRYRQDSCVLTVAPGRRVARLRVREDEEGLGDIWSQLEEAVMWEPDGLAADWDSGWVRSLSLASTLVLPRPAHEYQSAINVWGSGRLSGARWSLNPCTRPRTERGIIQTADAAEAPRDLAPELAHSHRHVHDQELPKSGPSWWQAEVSLRLRSSAGEHCRALAAGTLEQLRRSRSQLRLVFADLAHRHAHRLQIISSAHADPNMSLNTNPASLCKAPWLRMAADGALAARVRELLIALGVLNRAEAHRTLLREVPPRPTLLVLQFPCADPVPNSVQRAG